MSQDIDLAATQRRILAIVLEFAERGEILPSQQVIADLLKFKAGSSDSPGARSNVSRVLKELKAKGFIECEETDRGYIKTRTVRPARMVPTRLVPLLGRIAAGRPILADGSALQEFLPLPAQRIRGAEVYILKVNGNSMTGDGIHDGDYIVVAAGPEFTKGDISVVFVDGEATVKRVFLDGDKVSLVSSNSAYPPIPLAEQDNAVIQGKVIAVLRWFLQ